MNNSSNYTHPGKEFFQHVDSPPETGQEFLDWIANPALAFSAHEKAWIFNYFGQVLISSDPRYNDFEQVNWSGLSTEETCLKQPRGDILVVSEGDKHGFVLTKYRTDPKANLGTKDLSAFSQICASHLENCETTKLYLISTVNKLNHPVSQVVDLILRDDLLNPLTDYTLAIIFGDLDRAEEMNLIEMMDEYEKSKHDSVKQEKGKEKVNQPEESSDEDDPDWKDDQAKKTTSKKAKKTISKKVKKTTSKKATRNKYIHPKGIERVDWRTVILREIYQIHDERGRIDLTRLTSGKRGKALYQQVTTRKNQVWKGLVRDLRARITTVLRDMSKENILKKRDGYWTFCYPIQNKDNFQQLPWNQKWKHIETFSKLFKRLPEQKDAVNPTLTQLWLARQQLDYAIRDRIELIEYQEQTEFDSEEFIQQISSYIDKHNLSTNSNCPVLLPTIS